MPADTQFDIGQLDWLSGSWITEREGNFVEETWLEPEGGTMVGVSRTTKDGATTFEEYMRIGEWEGAFAMVLIHKLGGAVEVYPALEADAEHALFGNDRDRKHIRLHYRRDGDGVSATVSGLRGNLPFKLEFEYRRPG